MSEIFIYQDCSNSFKMSVRCLEFSIICLDRDDVTEGDIELMDRIEQVLNENASFILDDPDDDGADDDDA